VRGVVDPAAAERDDVPVENFHAVYVIHVMPRTIRATPAVTSASAEA
jgi:hypothetical protein